MTTRSAFFGSLVLSFAFAGCAASTTVDQSCKKDPHLCATGGSGGSTTGGSGGSTTGGSGGSTTGGSGGSTTGGSGGSTTGGSGGSTTGSTSSTGGSGGGSNNDPMVVVVEDGSDTTLKTKWGMRLLAGGWAEADGNLQDGLPDLSPDPAVVRDVVVSIGFSAPTCAAANGKVKIQIMNLPGWASFDKQGGANCDPLSTTAQADGAIIAGGFAGSASPITWVGGRRFIVVGPSSPVPVPPNAKDANKSMSFSEWVKSLFSANEEETVN